MQAVLDRDPHLITLRNDAGQSAVALAATRRQEGCIACVNESARQRRPGRRSGEAALRYGLLERWCSRFLARMIPARVGMLIGGA